MQAELDAALTRLQAQLANSSPVVSDLVTTLPVTLTDQAADDRSTARRLMGFLDNNPNRVKAITELTFDDLMVLPVGLKIPLSDNSQVMVGILKAEFLPTHAELTVFVRMQMEINDPNTSDRSRDLFFGVDKLKFTREGGFSGGGSFRAVLLGDFVLPMRNWTLVLKGGTGIAPPTSGTVAGPSQPTYVDIECNNFKEASLGARLIFPRTVLIPFDEATRKPVAGDQRVGVDFRVVTQRGLRDLLAEVSVSSGTGMAFASPKFPRVGFRLQQLVVDLSDQQNSTGMVFPEGYTGDRDASWQGVYIKDFAVLLPGEFKKKGGGGITLQANDVLVDRTGFTGLVSYSKLRHPVADDCDARGWKLTLDYFTLRFVQNDLTAGSFGGQIGLPISDTALSYAAVIDPATGLYAASVRTEGDLPVRMPAFRATGFIYRGSQLDLVYKEVNGVGEFYPKARLSGEFSLGSKVDANVWEEDPIDPENGTASFKQIQYTDLVLQTEVPYITLGDFRYSDQGSYRLAGFPVAIAKIAMSELQHPTDALWMDIGFRVALVQDKIAGASVLTLKTHYSPSEGKLKFDGIGVQSILVEANTSVFDLKGYVQVYDNETVKGFRGGLSVDIQRPMKVGVTANASFGYHKTEDFRYGYVDIYADVTSGLKSVGGATAPVAVGIPTGIGDLLINGAGLGVYFNMKPQFAGGGGSGSGCVLPVVSVSSGAPPIFAYCPNRQIPFGAKLMLGLVNSTQSFQGRFGVEFAMDSHYGLNSVALSGNGVFGQKPETVDASVSSSEEEPSASQQLAESAYYQQMMGFMVQGKGEAELGNQSGIPQTQEALEARAAENNQKKYGDKSGVAQEGDIAFSVGVLLGTSPFLLRIEGDVFVNKAGLRGTGPAGLAARVALNFQSGNTYLRFGMPDIPHRMGLRFKNNLTLGAYLMAGVGVPSFPRPPQEVINFFPSLKDGSLLNTPANAGQLSAGNAFALGANVDFRVNESGWLGFVRGQALGGFDLLLTNGSTCKPGAWWGQGQVYAVLDAEAGLFKTTLLQGSLGVYLAGNAFRPTGFEGEICLKLKKRNRCFSFTLGDRCSN